MSATEATYYSARPQVSVGGTPEPELGDELQSLLVEETVEGLFRCEARFGNWGQKGGAVRYLWSDRALLEFGADLSITAGPPGKSRRIFEGSITGLEGDFPAASPPTLTVLAEDALQDLRMTRRTRVFAQASDADVARQIAQDHGLAPQVSHTGPTHALLTQVNQSDLAFLRDRARAADALVRVEDGALHFQARASAAQPAISMAYGRELREVTLLADLAHQRSEIRVTGWDVAAKQPIQALAGAASVAGELAGLQGGGDLLTQKFASRADQVAHLVPFTVMEAQALADARYREAARRFLTGVCHGDGDGRVRVGAAVTLSGVSGLFDGLYAVVGVRHTFDGQRGYRTTFQVQRPGVGR